MYLEATHASYTSATNTQKTIQLKRKNTKTAFK